MVDRQTPARLVALALGVQCALGCSSEPEPVAPGTPPNEVELAQHLFDTYSGWTANDALSPECAVYFSACADVFARRAGYDPKSLSARNPRMFMVNPDPQWLPGWDKIPSEPGARHIAFGALTYAASMRAYFHSCQATAKEVEASRSAANTLLTTEAEAAAKETNPYKRLGRLVRVRQELRSRHPDPVGPRYDVEVLLRAEFEKAGRELIYDLRHQRPDDIGSLRPALSAEDERDLFCLDGLPSWQDNEAVPLEYVKVALPESRRNELMAKVKQAQDLDAKIPLREATVPALSERTSAASGTLLAFDKEVLKAPLFVRKVSDDAKSGGLVLELYGKALVKDAMYDCKEGDKPNKVDPSGTIHYPTDCKKRDESRKLTLLLKLAERPDVTIQPEDQVTFLGKLTKLTHTTTKGSPAVVQYELEAEGKHVLEIWRHQLLVADYFVQ